MRLEISLEIIFKNIIFLGFWTGLPQNIALGFSLRGGLGLELSVTKKYFILQAVETFIALDAEWASDKLSILLAVIVLQREAVPLFAALLIHEALRHWHQK